MKIEIIFMGENPHSSLISKMLNEDMILSGKESANMSLKALGSQIYRIEQVEGVQKIYIKPFENLILG